MRRASQGGEDLLTRPPVRAGPASARGSRVELAQAQASAQVRAQARERAAAAPALAPSTGAAPRTAPGCAGAAGPGGARLLLPAAGDDNLAAALPANYSVSLLDCRHYSIRRESSVPPMSR